MLDAQTRLAETRTEERGMNLFDYVRPGIGRRSRRRRVRAGRRLSGRRHQPARPDEGRRRAPDRLVDVTRLPGLDRIETPAGRRGPDRRAWCATPTSPTTRPSPRAYPAVAEALLSGASAQLRNAATVGGNLMQRTRCAYFQDAASACNRREPGSGCDALRRREPAHAVLGWSESCIATHPSDFCVPLVALDAVVEIEGPDRAGARSRWRTSTVCPATTPERETVLAPGDLIVALRLPAEAAGFRATCALPEASRAHLLRLRARLRRRGARRSRAARSAGAPRARRRRGEAVAGRAAEDAAGRRGPRPRALRAARPRPRWPTRSRPATTPSRSSSPKRIVVARARPRRGRHARAAARPAGFGLCLRSRSAHAMPDTISSKLAHVRARLEHRPAADPPRRHAEGHRRGARYAADNHPAGMLHAVVAVSSIARGRVAFLDVEAAKAHPGVVEVITPANRPPLAQDPDAKVRPFSFRIEALQNDRVRYAKQPIALVVAETLEAATEGARLLAPRYETEPARTGFDDGERFVPPAVGIGARPNFDVGDIEAGLPPPRTGSRPTYETPAQYHNAMEPHAIVAEWDGDQLTIDTPNQAMALAQAAFAAFFGIPPENVHIRSPFLGGGFGSKAIIAGPQILAILAARMLGRPVKLVLRREQMFGPVGHRGATRQTLRLGMDGDGRLTALRHHAMSTTSSFDDFVEPAANASHNALRQPGDPDPHEAVRIDTGTPGPMRAPGEASGSAALEAPSTRPPPPAASTRWNSGCATTPRSIRSPGKPFSSKALRECYAEARNASAGSERPLAPRRCATRTASWSAGAWARRRFPAPMFQAEARAVLRGDGTGLVETSGADMGQGAWTALAQIAADGLGLDIDQVEFRSGHFKAARRRHRRRLGPYRDGGRRRLHRRQRRHRQARRARHQPTRTRRSSAPAMPASSARGGRLYRSDDESRGESYADILARAGRRRDRGTRQGRPRSGARRGPRDVRPRRRLRRGQGRSRSRPGPGDAPGRRLRRGSHHQPAPGAQPVLRRHDLGRVLRAPRGGAASTAARAGR